MLLTLPLAGLPLDRTLIVSALIGILPFAALRYARWKEVREIEQSLPDFLRDLADSVRSGIPIHQAIKAAAGLNYGRLTPHIQRMKREISAGLSFEEALRRFASRVGTPRVERTVSLILRASRAGGRIADVLDAVSAMEMELAEHSRKQKSSMMGYAIIAYVAFFVFLGIVYSLAKIFLPAMVEAAAAEPEAIPGFDLEAFENAFFYLAVVQGGAAGILAGKLGEGRMVAGLKHSVLLIAVAYAFFFVL